MYKINYEKIKNYIKSGECKIGESKIGLEVEHFITKKRDGKSVNYYEENGIKEMLIKLKEKWLWEPMIEEGNIIGLVKDSSTITLEPGAQMEISVKPCNDIEELEKEYLSILGEMKDVIHKEHEISVYGYHPRSRIEEIPFIPKKRYKYMSEYLSKRGKYALNMMKGTASTQVSIDYQDEEDFGVKFRVANFLSPLIYYIFENSPYFEGDIWDKKGLRMHIWNNCDNDRSGTAEGGFNPEVRYGDYAEYILKGIPIISKMKGEYLYTESLPTKDVFGKKPIEEDEVEHVLSMFFPDVRVKKYIEIRTADALPYPYCVGYAAFIKGIFYSENILKRVYKESLDFELGHIEECKRAIMEGSTDGGIYNGSFKEYALELIEDIRGANPHEKRYMDILYKFIEEKDI